MGEIQIKEIRAIEATNSGRQIHLIQDGLFYRVWEQSAWLFYSFLKEYKVMFRFYKNLQEELVFMGFPISVLQLYLGEARNLGWEVKVLNARHTLLCLDSKVEPSSSFEAWRIEQLAGQSITSKEGVNKSRQKAILKAYRLSYDFSLDIYRVSAKINRDLKFSLGERLRFYVSSFSEFFHFIANDCADRLSQLSQALLDGLRIRLILRQLKDLRALSEKWWLRLSESLDMLIKQLDLWKSQIKSQDLNPKHQGV